ncbi:hypothetical protein K2Z84_05300 [Candidatus Binatia bacterium]|nr:hypothetical protein [Candidatus Binatia bacterium]
MNPLRYVGWYVAALVFAAGGRMLRPGADPKDEAVAAIAFANRLMGYDDDE